MSLSIRLSSEMTDREIAPLGRDITRCLKRFVDDFPKVATLEGLWKEIVQGSLQMWLIFDDDDGRVILVQLTEIITNEATGHRFVRLLNSGGERIVEALPLLADIEAWAKDVQGVTEMESVGRQGTARILAPHGYRITCVTATKEL